MAPPPRPIVQRQRIAHDAVAQVRLLAQQAAFPHAGAAAGDGGVDARLHGNREVGADGEERDDEPWGAVAELHEIGDVRRGARARGPVPGWGLQVEELGEAGGEGGSGGGGGEDELRDDAYVAVHGADVVASVPLPGLVGEDMRD